jgi:hypothetical protein
MEGRWNPKVSSQGNGPAGMSHGLKNISKASLAVQDRIGKTGH